MAESVGQIGLDLVVNKNGFDKQMRGINGLAKKAAVALASAFAVKKLVDFGKSAVNLGSQLAEVDNVIQQAVPSMEKKIDLFAKNAIDQFGMSEIAAKRFTGVFSSMARGFGFSEKSAASMGTTLTSLAADVASFYDTSQDEAFTKLKSVFTGETETLKDLGVVMTQSALDAYALANGYKKTTKSMSEAEKVALRYAFVQEKLKFAQGDFARNSNSWANQVRILSERFNALKATIGQGLINALLPVIKTMNTLIGKIQTVANAFQNLTAKVFGKAEQGASGVASATEGIGNATEGAIGGIEDASKSAKKAAKEAKAAATSIDELNIISPEDSKEDSTGGVGNVDIGSGLIGDMATATEDASERTITALDKIKAKLYELADIFKDGVFQGLGSFDTAPLLGHIASIRKSLKDVFTDPAVLSSADNLVNAVVLSLGKITGSAARIGLTVAELVTGSLDKYLVQNEDFIKDRIVGILDVTSRGAEILGNFTVAIADIFTVFKSDSAKQIGADLISILVNSFLSITELALMLGVDIIEAIVNPIINNKDRIKLALENILKPVSIITSAISTLVTNTWKSIFDTYKKYIQPAFDNISNGFNTIFKAVLNAYNNYLAPVLSHIAERFSWLIENALQPLIDAFLGLAGRIIEAISMLWNYLAPFVGWFADFFIATISNAIAWLWPIIEGVVTLVMGVITSIIQGLNGLIDIIIGTFTGDWERAWDGVKEIFSSIWTIIKTFVITIINAILNTIKAVLTSIKTTVNTILNAIKIIFEKIFDAIKNKVTFWGDAIKSVVTTIMNGMKSLFDGGLGKVKDSFVKIFTSIKDTVSNIFTGLWNNIKGIINSILSGVESMANGVIKGINSAIQAMNNLSFDVPDWIPGIGGKSFGFNIPSLSQITIPKLAQGGYVKANTPQLAMIGDNLHQGEVVAPEGKMLEMAIKAAELVNNSRQDNVYMPIIIESLNQIIEILDALDLSFEMDGKSLLGGLKEARTRLGFEF